MFCFCVRDKRLLFIIYQNFAIFNHRRRNRQTKFFVHARLAVCLYHSPEDFFRIPRFLVECDLGYRFYLEHHFMNGWETVLYAVPS